MRRSLTIEGAPDGTVPAGATDASWQEPDPQPPRSVEPLAAVCLEETRASEASWLLWFVSASGKPHASAQAVTRYTHAGCSSLHVLRESVAACRWLL